MKFEQLEELAVRAAIAKLVPHQPTLRKEPLREAARAEGFHVAMYVESFKAGFKHYCELPEKEDKA